DRSKIYAKFGKEIYMAAKSDPSIDTNATLRGVLDKAKTYKIPREIIDRAINKAKSGVDESYDHIRYEGYGPSGSAIIVDTLTDNVNRTVAEVRAAFNKVKGNLGVSGSVSYLFEALSIFGLDLIDEDILWDLFIENDCDIVNIETQEDQVIIYGKASEYSKIVEALKTIDISDFKIAEINMVANDELTLSEDELEVFERLIDLLESIDDVQEVYHNVIV
ncbi:MAG: YebC/PmpR family DNA-binding transcriptional regulator, partial [Bacilli bacterium]